MFAYSMNIQKYTQSNINIFNSNRKSYYQIAFLTKLYHTDFTTTPFVTDKMRNENSLFSYKLFNLARNNMTLHQ